MSRARYGALLRCVALAVATYMLGPLICLHDDNARAVCSALFADIGNTFVRLDSLGEINDWLVAQGLALVDRPATMVRGETWQPVHNAPQRFARVPQAMGQRRLPVGSTT